MNDVGCWLVLCWITTGIAYPKGFFFMTFICFYYYFSQVDRGRHDLLITSIFCLVVFSRVIHYHFHVIRDSRSQIPTPSNHLCPSRVEEMNNEYHRSQRDDQQQPTAAAADRQPPRRSSPAHKQLPLFWRALEEAQWRLKYRIFPAMQG